MPCDLSVGHFYFTVADEFELCTLNLERRTVNLSVVYRNDLQLVALSMELPLDAPGNSG